MYGGWEDRLWGTVLATQACEPESIPRIQVKAQDSSDTPPRPTPRGGAGKDEGELTEEYIQCQPLASISTQTIQCTCSHTQERETEADNILQLLLGLQPSIHFFSSLPHSPSRSNINCSEIW